MQKRIKINIETYFFYSIILYIMDVDYTYNKLIRHDRFILNKIDKKNIIDFYNGSNNIFKKILVEDYISVTMRAKIGDIICFVDKHMKRYRLVV
jgi:hypothetical protein